MPPRNSDELRSTFLDFFAERGHTVVPSASLIPHDASLLFTVAGMVPFKPYFVGEEPAPYPRATSVQKCVRAGGKHNDLDDIGRTNRHFSFFEMLGNFSFGDYFKAEAIPFAWELYTQGLDLDPNRLWVTVHETDDEAAAIWRDVIGVPEERIQRMGEDNFWRMADTGPCGPCTEIFWDLGPEFGADGGPKFGSEDRFVEVWNLVFMQFDARPDGSLAPLPKPSVDTGAGLERNLAVLQGVPTVWDIDFFREIIAQAERTTGVAYGSGGEPDVSLRILAEHGRAMTFLVSDGVVPSNVERGYVLRRIIRRAVRHAYRLGTRSLVTPSMVEATIAAMGSAYPDLVKNRDLVLGIVGREEERFLRTLARGVELLDDVLEEGDVSGDKAFFLHDTLGFPIDLSREIAGERGRGIDVDGFESLMGEQRTRARDALKAAGGSGGAPVELYREILDDHGPTEFTGRVEYVTEGSHVLAILSGGERLARAGSGAEVDVFLDRTPFYAESGGQVGDTGSIENGDGLRMRVLDTTYAIPGTLSIHRVRIEAGEIVDGVEVTAAIDGDRRDDIRRNHTATHILHWALREVLGDHIKQAGSHVAPERLRFDFSHFEGVTQAEIDRIEGLANAEVISDASVRNYETTKAHAESIGAVAFFGDKYGDVVRVLEAGPQSIELCGGTHVHALGFIGPIKILSEGSVGANMRRIEAVTGSHALEKIRDDEKRMRSIASSMNTTQLEVPEKIERLMAQVKSLGDEVAALRAKQAAAQAGELAANAEGGIVVVRRDGFTPDELRLLAAAVRDALPSGIAAVIGLNPDGDKAGLAVAVTKDLVANGASAATIAQGAARLLGGGTAKSPDLVVGGGPKIAAIEEAMSLVVAAASEAVTAG